MIKESEIKYFFINMLLKGHPDWLSYRIPEESSNRLRKVFMEDDDGKYDPMDSIQFLAYNKRRVIFRMDDILAVNFLWDPIQGQIYEEEEECEDIKIYFTDRSEPIVSDSSDGESVYTFAENYANSRMFKSPYISFLDSDAEEIVVNANKVGLMEIPEYLMLEGGEICFKEIEKDMKECDAKGEEVKDDNELF
jgi:hypothetical protein